MSLTRVARLTFHDFIVTLFDLFITKAVVIPHEEPFEVYFAPRRRPRLKSLLTGALDVVAVLNCLDTSGDETIVFPQVCMKRHI